MILTSYIFRQTLRNVIVSTLAFMGVIWLSQSFKTIKLIISKGANILDFFTLSAYSFPNWILIALPFGVFAGCMISYLKLQNDNEILVMKSAGCGPIKISAPAIIIAILCSLILFVISHIILPLTYKNFKELQNEIRNNSKELILKDNIFVDINKNQTIFIGEVHDDIYLKEIFIQDRSKPNNQEEYFSKQGQLNVSENNIILLLSEGTRISTNDKDESTILNFDKYNILIKRDKNNLNKGRVVEYNEYSYFQLIKKSQEKNAKQGKLLAEAHNRNTITFLPLVFVLVLMVSLLKGNELRIVSKYKKTTSIATLIVIQSLIIIIKNAVHSNPFLLPMMYIFPISVITLSVFLLNKNYKFKGNFVKKFEKDPL